MSISDFHFSYNLIYFFTAFLAIVSTLSNDIIRDSVRQRKIGSVLIFIPIFFLIPLIGLRGFDVGTDTNNYYNILWNEDLDLELTNDFLFTFLAIFLKYLHLSYSYFLFITASLFVFTTYISLNKISKFYYCNVFYLFFTYFSFFFFLSMSINIIRQGISLAFLLFAYSYLLNKEKKIKILICIIISLSFHITSAIALILFFIACYRTKYIKNYHYYILFVLCVVLSYMNFGLLNISPFIVDLLGSDNRKVSYLADDDFGYNVGFKPQFVLFNAIFLCSALFLKAKIKKDSWSFNYDILIRYYILASCLFFMAFQLPFSDRWGLMSWYVIPLLLIPIFSCNHVKFSIKIPWIVFLILIFIGFNFYV